jgi:hypothetical protein
MEPTAIECVDHIIYGLISSLDDGAHWTYWRQHYGSLTDELHKHINTYDTLENLPRELAQCWSNMPKSHQELILRYISDRYNPNCYRTYLTPFSDVDQRIATQAPLMKSLIELYRRARDSGEYQAVWDFARLDTVETATAEPSIINCFMQLSVATCRLQPGTFHNFGTLDRKWLDRSKPWLMDAFTAAGLKC